MSISGGVSRVDPTAQEKIEGTDRVIVGIGDADSVADVQDDRSGRKSILVEDSANDAVIDLLDKIHMELRLTNELLKGILQ